MKRVVRKEDAIPLGREHEIGSLVLITGRRMKITAINVEAGTITAED